MDKRCQTQKAKISKRLASHVSAAAVIVMVATAALSAAKKEMQVQAKCSQDLRVCLLTQRQQQHHNRTSQSQRLCSVLCRLRQRQL